MLDEMESKTSGNYATLCTTIFSEIPQKFALVKQASNTSNPETRCTIQKSQKVHESYRFPKIQGCKEQGHSTYSTEQEEILSIFENLGLQELLESS